MAESKEGDKVGGKYLVERDIDRGKHVFLVSTDNGKVFYALKKCDDVPNAYLEAQVGMAHDNANLIRVIDKVEENNKVYIVMEYVDGVSLEKRIKNAKENPISITEAQNIVTDVANGLEELHKDSYIHRDIKPSNILLGKNGTAKVGDLGSVYHCDLETTSSPATSTGKIQHLGTEGYKSPEQKRGDPLLTTASDIYSLGLVLFEILTLKPYNDRTLKKKDILKKWCQWPKRWSALLQNKAPSWLKHELHEMLQQDPSKRPQSGQDVVNRLKEGEKNYAKHMKQKISWLAACILLFLLFVTLFYTKVVIPVIQPWSQTQMAIALLTSSPQSTFTVTPTASSTSTQDPTITSTASQTSSPSETNTLPATITPTLTPSPLPPPTDTATPIPPGFAITSTVDAMVMLYVPAGPFTMGAIDDDNAKTQEVPAHVVSLNAFWIDQTEITVGMYEKCVKDRGCRAPSRIAIFEPDPQNYPGRYYYPNYVNYPMIGITWADAQQYCDLAHRRLPTEAEWEKAARGTDGRIYPWGNSEIDLTLCNYNNNHTFQVGFLPNGASPYNAMDMCGNVLEWVFDWYDAAYYNFFPANEWPSNPQGPASGGISNEDWHVLRGGSYYQDAVLGKTTYRDGRSSDYVAVHVGFRCAKDYVPGDIGP